MLPCIKQQADMKRALRRRQDSLEQAMVSRIPGTARLLQRNLEIKAIHNVVVEPVALSDRSGEAKLFKNPANAANLGLEDASRSEVAVLVTTTTLDEYLHGGEVELRLMKLDVEGAEVKVPEERRKLSRATGAAVCLPSSESRC